VALAGLANSSLKLTKAGRRTVERLEGRGVASFARHPETAVASLHFRQPIPEAQNFVP